MPITLKDFHAASEANDPHRTLRLNLARTAIVRSDWEKFKVAFCDFFRFKKSIAAERARTMDVYLETIRKQHGPQMCELAAAQFAEHLGTPEYALTAHKIRETTALLALSGAEHGLPNEEAIRLAAHGPKPDQWLGRPTLADLIEPECQAFRTQAKGLGIANEKLRFLDDSVKTASETVPHVSIPCISEAIEKTLYAAAITRADDGTTTLRALENPDIVRLGRAAVRQALIPRFNTVFHQAYEQAHPARFRWRADAKFQRIGGNRQRQH